MVEWEPLDIYNGQEVLGKPPLPRSTAAAARSQGYTSDILEDEFDPDRMGQLDCVVDFPSTETSTSSDADSSEVTGGDNDGSMVGIVQVDVRMCDGLEVVYATGMCDVLCGPCGPGTMFSARLGEAPRVEAELAERVRMIDAGQLVLPCRQTIGLTTVKSSGSTMTYNALLEVCFPEDFSSNKQLSMRFWPPPSEVHKRGSWTHVVREKRRREKKVGLPRGGAHGSRQNIGRHCDMRAQNIVGEMRALPANRQDLSGTNSSAEQHVQSQLSSSSTNAGRNLISL